MLLGIHKRGKNIGIEAINSIKDEKIVKILINIMKAMIEIPRFLDELFSNQFSHKN